MVPPLFFYMTYIFFWIIVFIAVIAVVRHYVQKKASLLKTVGMGIATLLVAMICSAIVLSLFDTGTDFSSTSDNNSQNSSIKAISNTTQEDPSLINVDSIIEVMKKDFNFSKDEFDENGRVWVETKNKPYRWVNGYYCYFQLNDDKSVSNFRFVIQYESDDWLFINKCIFNIDGDNFEFIPTKMERDNSGGRIWEWCDESVGRQYENLIRRIAKAKTIKVKLNGDQYYNTRTISSKQIESIDKVLEYYEKLGGKF